MKTIIYRNKQTNKIVQETDEYQKMLSEGKNEEQIQALVNTFNESNNSPNIAEIVELSELDEFYRNQNKIINDKVISKLIFLKETLQNLISTCDGIAQELSQLPK